MYLVSEQCAKQELGHSSMRANEIPLHDIDVMNHLQQSHESNDGVSGLGMLLSAFNQNNILFNLSRLSKEII